jgi:nucleotide-binding universal stress UspA family protein
MALFNRLFAVRPQDLTVRYRVKRNPAERQSILVHVGDSFVSKRAVELACCLAADGQGSIILAHVIEVPRTLPLNVPLPDLEEQGQHVLNTAALTINPSHLMCESRIVRDRTTAGGLAQLARDEHVNMVVMGFGGSLQEGLGDLITVSDLFRSSPCEVVIARAPLLLGRSYSPVGLEWSH